jgi:outer membrane lipoprotein-sorting protein
MRRALALCLLLLLLPAPARADDAADIARVEAWMGSLTTARARFVQTAHSGAQAVGTFSLSRPGRLRFAYDDSDDFIVADGTFIYYYDAQMGQQSNAPIGSTLADFILRKDFSLAGDLRVTEVRRAGGLLQLTIVQADAPEDGRLMLAFTEAPFALKKWRVLDAAGRVTEVELFHLETGVDFPRGTFWYVDPNPGRTPYNE